MSIHSLCGGFAKTQRGCHKKNDMAQSHHFTEIVTGREKVLKKRSKLFAILNHNISNTCDKNHDIAILCRDYIKKNHKVIMQIAMSQFFLCCDCAKIQISNSNFKFKFQIQISNSNFKFKFQMQISNSNVKVKLQIQILNSIFKFKFQIQI